MLSNPSREPRRLCKSSTQNLLRGAKEQLRTTKPLLAYVPKVGNSEEPRKQGTFLLWELGAVMFPESWGCGLWNAVPVIMPIEGPCGLSPNLYCRKPTSQGSCGWEFLERSCLPRLMHYTMSTTMESLSVTRTESNGNFSWATSSPISTFPCPSLYQAYNILINT